MAVPTSLEACYQVYLNQGQIYSAHTRSAYARSVALFFKFLEDRHASTTLPVHRLGRSVHQLNPQDFSHGDIPILATFGKWLSLPGDGKDKRPYAQSTIALRVAGVQHFLTFMAHRGWLPDEFSINDIVAAMREEPKAPIEKNTRSQVIVADLSPIIHYYDMQQPPQHMVGNEAAAERLYRWELVRLRNRALLHALAETGGRVSELLSLQAGDIFSENTTDAVSISVVGKNGHNYNLFMKQSWRRLVEYINKRDIPDEQLDDAPLFVSHDPRYNGNRMSRIVAWRVVRRAAKAVGMGDVSPHDFRHWRAYQLITSGQSLSDVRDLLGHRSIETVRALYEHLLDDTNTSSTME